MGTINITSEEDYYTSISNNFIEYYMTDANGDFVKLYLYLAMLCSAKRPISVSDIADHLNCTEKDVCRGLRYWIKEDVVKLLYNDAKEVTGIVLMNLKRPENILSAELKVVDYKLSIADKDDTASKPSAASVPETSDDNASDNIVKAPRKKQPTVMDLNGKMQDKEFYNLRMEAEAYCNRELDQKDLNSLIYIKDQLGFSFDLCEYLLEYCAHHKKTSFNYIEKVARTWFENSIDNRDDAEAFSIKYTLYGRVLKALGIGNRTSAVPSEIDYVNSWMNTFGFSDEIILEACKRAIDRKPQGATFAYVNGILADWNKNNVRRLSDILQQDERFNNEKKNNNVTNFTSREAKHRDADRLKQIEKYYLGEL